MGHNNIITLGLALRTHKQIAHREEHSAATRVVISKPFPDTVACADLLGGIPYIGLFGAKASKLEPADKRVAVMVGAPQPLSDLEEKVAELLVKLGPRL